MHTARSHPGLVRLARRAWVTPDQAAELVGRCRAVLDTCVDDSVIASYTAGSLRGLWLPERNGEPIHVATATPDRRGRTMTRTQRPEFIAHRFQLRPKDIEMVHGLPVTSIPRTWRDLAMILPLADLVAAGDRALQLGVTPEELADAVAAGSQRHNVLRARAALELLDRRSRSRPESHLRVAISGDDMPKFEVNVAIHRSTGGWLAEPDLSLAEARIALEYQGADHADVRRMRRDLTRFVDIRRDDWLTLPYGPAEVFGRPWEIKPEVRNCIRQRAPHLLRAPHLRSVVS